MEGDSVPVNVMLKRLKIRFINTIYFSNDIKGGISFYGNLYRLFHPFPLGDAPNV